MQETTQLPECIARLTTVNGFIESYHEKLPRANTCKEAYEMADEEYRILFGASRYANYETFKNTLKRWNQKRRKQKSTASKK